MGPMTDDGHAPTVPDTQAPTHGGASSSSGPPKAPDTRYVLRDQLGRGGMGEVWLAHDSRVDRDIAIKVMRAGQGDPTQVARFLREARVQGRLDHPCVVPVHDLAADAATPFFAMKRVTGTTLAKVIDARDDVKWPRRTLLARFVDICLAMEFAHQAGVVHRDLKPANIMLGDFGEAYVLDWGLARIVGDSDVTRVETPPPDAGGQTQAGAMLGTPGYMSPEQMRGEAIDQRTDIYALGCILFEILVGAPAIPRDSALESTLSAREHRPASRIAEIPPELDAACANATKAERSERLASARALADAVQRFLDGDRDLARRRELAAQHLARAQQHLERGDAGRVEALREAGSAIALDVENAAAAQLLGRLLLEPPANVPPAAQQALDAARRVTEREVLKSGVVAYIMFLGALPTIYLLGVSAIWPLFVGAAEVLVLMALCIVGVRQTSLLSVRHAMLILFAHCALLGSFSIIVGPLLLVPVLIFGSATIMFVSSAIRVPILIFVAHLLVIAVPLLLELVGVLPRTFALEGGALVLRPWAIALSPTAMIGAVVGTVVLQLLGNMLMLDRLRVAQKLNEERIHMQAWQLQQLVPSSGSTR